eukprot:2684540-Rhodomonas_salina.2
MGWGADAWDGREQGDERVARLRAPAQGLSAARLASAPRSARCAIPHRMSAPTLSLSFSLARTHCLSLSLSLCLSLSLWLSAPLSLWLSAALVPRRLRG